jgi:hypothetical protein
VSESEYDGGFERLTGSVVDERVIRSVTICAERVGDHQRWPRGRIRGEAYSFRKCLAFSDKDDVSFNEICIQCLKS